MLLIKSKYKIAKRLGAGIFEQTQTQKFALSEARAGRKQRGGRGASDYGKQLLEKQRVRFTYGLSERQLANYAARAFEQKDPSLALHRALEMRADNVAYRSGLTPSRRAGRQAVSHGHLTVNGRRITTPSYRVHVGDIVVVREGSHRSPLFAGLAEEKQENPKAVPSWLDVDLSVLRVKVSGEPAYNPIEIGLDYATVFEFYSR